MTGHIQYSLKIELAKKIILLSRVKYIGGVLVPAKIARLMLWAIFSICLLGCSVFNNKELAVNGLSHIEQIKRDGVWLLALPKPQIVRMEYQSDTAKSYSELLCRFRISAEAGSETSERQVIYEGDMGCVEDIQRDLLASITQKQKQKQIESTDVARSALEKLREYVLVNSFKAFSCNREDNTPLPSKIIHAMVSYWGVNDTVYMKSLSVIEQYNSRLRLDISPVKGAEEALANAADIIHYSPQSLPALEDFVKKCESSKLQQRVIKAVDKTLSSIDRDPFSSTRYSLQLEKGRSLPSAFNSEINELVVKIDTATSKFNSVVDYAKSTSAAATNDDEFTTFRSFSNQLALLAEMIELDINSLVLLSREQQINHWSYLERIARASNGAMQLSPLIKASRLNSLALLSDKQDRMNCIGEASHVLSSALKVFQQNPNGFDSSSRVILINKLELADQALANAKCGAVSELDPCKSSQRGTREYFRLATNSILKAISTQTAELDAQSDELSLDDWQLARNIVTAQMLQGVNIGLKAITSDSACALGS
jgi:hypothetical protein